MVYIDTQNFWQQARVKRLTELDLKVLTHFARCGSLRVRHLKASLKLSNPYRQVNKLRAMGLLERDAGDSLQLKLTGLAARDFINNYFRINQVALVKQLNSPIDKERPPLDSITVILTKGGFEKMVVKSMLAAQFRIDAHFSEEAMAVSVKSCFYRVDRLGKRILIDRRKDDLLPVKLQYICIDRHVLYVLPYVTAVPRKFFALRIVDPVLISYLLPR